LPPALPLPVTPKPPPPTPSMGVPMDVDATRKARSLPLLMGDLRELDLETRVITNGNKKSPRCFTVVH